MTPEGESIKTTRVSDDGTRLVIVTRWLDRQNVAPEVALEEPHAEAHPGRDRLLPTASTCPEELTYHREPGRASVGTPRHRSSVPVPLYARVV